MLVDEWVVTLWSILNVREKTIRDYKHLYKRHLQPVIGSFAGELTLFDPSVYSKPKKGINSISHFEISILGYSSVTETLSEWLLTKWILAACNYQKR